MLVNDKEFNEILRKAISGDIDATYKIIKEYEGVIVKNSIINGVFDEECKANIEIKIIENIKKFRKFS